MLRPVPAPAAHQQVTPTIVPRVTITMIDVLAIMLTHSALALEQSPGSLPRSIVSTMLKVVLPLIP